MEKSSIRLRRISDFIRNQIALFLKKEVYDPRLANVAITEVDVSPDLNHAKIYFTLLDKNELPATLKALEKASGYLRHLLSKDSPLRNIPQLHFIYDEVLAHGEAINHLMAQVAKKDSKKNKS